MSRLKTFLTYILILVAFFLVSTFLEKGLINNMYYNMTGTVDSNLNYDGENIDLETKVISAKSTNVNGNIVLKIKNNSNKYIDEAYVKVLLYSKSDVLAATKYMKISGLSANEEKTYTLRFKGSYVKTYAITAEKEFPDKDYIFSIFGYEINTKNIFGMDLSKYINAKSIGEFGRNVVYSIKLYVQSIPWWGWMLAWTVVAGVW